MMIEVVRTITEMPSRKQPSTMKKIVSTISNVVIDRSIAPIQAARLRGKPVKPIATDKNAAPSKISAIMHDVRVADKTASPNNVQLNEPDSHASNAANTTPNAAVCSARVTP